MGVSKKVSGKPAPATPENKAFVGEEQNTVPYQ